MGRFEHAVLVRHLVEGLFEHDGLHDDLDDVGSDEQLAEHRDVQPLGSVCGTTQLALLVHVQSAPHLDPNVAEHQNRGETQVKPHLVPEHLVAGRPRLVLV